MTKYPLMHRACGGIAAFFTGNGMHYAPRLEAATFERVDGTHPQRFERFNEVCGACGARITEQGQLRLIHHKAIDIAQAKFVKDAYDPHGYWVTPK